MSWKVLPLLALAACATTPEPKMSFAEAFAGEPVARSRPVALKVVKMLPADAVAQTSVELQSALLGFAARSRSARAQAVKGARMPVAQAENWNQVLAELDAFLQRPAVKTSSYDLIRARIVLESEVENDGRVFGDFPQGLADSVVEHVNQIAVRMAQVRVLGVKTVAGKAEYEWPVDPVAITSVFGRRLHPITHELQWHGGVDLMAYSGQRVSAAERGTVTNAGWNGARGRSVEVQHPGGVITRYSHLSVVLVEPGAVVERGDAIGLAGTTGLSTGVHVHFELVRDGKARDPLDELGQPEDKEPVARELHGRRALR